jgi:hypothetical protein
MSILIDDRPFRVRPNLYAFLTDLSESRETGGHGFENLWIDATSIDQNHIAERNHQVGIMANIYARAVRVVLWLGPLDETCRPIHNLVREMSEALEVNAN